MTKNISSLCISIHLRYKKLPRAMNVSTTYILNIFVIHIQSSQRLRSHYFTVPTYFFDPYIHFRPLNGRQEKIDLITTKMMGIINLQKI